jgi:Na+/H+ antiporter NhaD/arsenite permease-like protein
MTNISLNLPNNLSATDNYLAIAALIIFILSYVAVILEEKIELRKSKPVLLASGIIWILTGFLAKKYNLPDFANFYIKKTLLEYAELLLFLIVAMTYIHSLEERQIFNGLRIWLINKKFTLRKLFWITGFLAFFISPIADNLTTALLMSTIISTVAPKNHKFICYSCINIVVAANAGGAFSPFGDLTTLMVWQNNKLPFIDFFRLFIPSVISFTIPAFFMSFYIEDKLPPTKNENIYLKEGAKIILLLFLCTIILSVLVNHILNLPAVIGMMIGFSLLSIFGFYLKKRNPQEVFDIFKLFKNIEWDTLLFFYGIIISIGGLGAIGYLEKVSHLLYNNLGSNLPIIHQHTPANILIGLFSAILDNIPLMFAVIAMDPNMIKGQWLLLTLTLGIGGSLLSIGSAAGVAIMGQTKGIYSFSGHLKWSWAILLGYVAAIYVHFLINSSLFN